jgi:hypothetical protein
MPGLLLLQLLDCALRELLAVGLVRRQPRLVPLAVQRRVTEKLYRGGTLWGCEWGRRQEIVSIAQCRVCMKHKAKSVDCITIVELGVVGECGVHVTGCLLSGAWKEHCLNHCRHCLATIGRTVRWRGEGRVPSCDLSAHIMYSHVVHMHKARGSER